MKHTHTHTHTHIATSVMVKCLHNRQPFLFSTTRYNNDPRSLHFRYGATRSRTGIRTKQEQEKHEPEPEQDQEQE